MNHVMVIMTIIVIIIIALFFKVEKLSRKISNNYENATNTSPLTDADLLTINNQISSIYNMDVEAIRIIKKMYNIFFIVSLYQNRALLYFDIT